MAQKSSNLCMYCDSNPCACNTSKKPVPTRKPATTKPVPTRPTPTRPVTTTPVPTSPAPTNPPETTSDVFDKSQSPKGNVLSRRKSFTTTTSKKDPALTGAVLALMEYFSPDVDFIEAHRDILDIPDHTVDAMIWRRDHALHGTKRAGRSS